MSHENVEVVRRGASVRRLALLLAAVLALTLTLAVASRAEAFIYWTSHRFGGTIGRANLDGTGVDQSFITDASTLWVAVDAGHIYWAGSNTVARANFHGTGVDQSFITGAVFPTGVAVDTTHVYWANSCDIVTGPNSCFGDGSIGRADLDGTGVDQSFITGLPGPLSMAVGPAHVYWVDAGGTMGRANLDGTGVDRSFITGLDPLTGLAVDDEHIYWTDTDLDAIGRANIDGTGVDQFFITVGAPTGVAVDAGHIYWAAGNTIGRANLEGARIDRRFITGLAPRGVAVDALRSFSFGNVKRKEEKGIAKLTVKVPGSGELELTNTTEVAGAKKRAEAKGTEKLPVRGKGETKKTLNRKGKAKVKAEVTYTPAGDNPTIVGNTDTKSVKLVKR
jgi:Low-density lipoprotein receptor repeat class B